MKTNFRINVEDLFDVKLLSIVENDLNNGIPFTIVYADGLEQEIKDVEGFQSLLDGRNLV